uniref:Elongin-A n=1 Tax=Phallusia mammillata TaxID=59560 RepID=A0A6F9DC11_9ASCI|nr:RNA polymerase II transcription factor SIII subunit A3-like-1 [Phallusia mammillata]
MNENGLQTVLRYKTRLDPQTETKKIVRALQKLSEVEMTIDILQETGIGKVVNNLRKHDEVGGFAKELVSSWKQLLSNKPSSKHNSPNKYQSSTSSLQNANNDEYDPSGNWEMKKQKEKKKKLKYSSESEEYDPTQNWKMDKSDEYSPEYPQITKTMKKQKQKGDEQNKSDVSGHQPAKNQSDFLPNVSDSDEDNSSNDDQVASYLPSVSSTTLYSNKTHSKQQVLTNGENLYEKQSKKQKNHKRKSETSATPPIKSSKATKRKSDSAMMESPSNKVKKSAPASVDKVKKQTKKESSGNFSFEDFMAMDTTKKIKKKKKTQQKSANTSQLQNSLSPSKQKVELHLPKVQSVYRPLPQIDPTDPYSTPSSSSNHQHSMRMTDEVAAELHSQRSSGRMQIYSGQKTSYLPKMMSLYDQCMTVLMNNIDKLDVIGVPYDIIKPVLERCTAEQLYHLEDVNVYLLDDTDELWKKLSQQDFRGKVPDEMESWRELYLRLHDAREEKLARLTQTIQAKVIKSKPLEKRTKLAYVGIGQAKAPRNVQRAQLKYGTAGKRTNQASDCNGTSSLKQQTTELRMSVPVGSITAASVDAQTTSKSWSKKQPPRVAPMMAKTMKTIHRLRMRR